MGEAQDSNARQLVLVEKSMSMRLEDAFNRASAETPMRLRRTPNLGVFMTVLCKSAELHEPRVLDALLAWCAEAGSAMGKCKGVTFVVDWYGPVAKVDDALEWRVVARPA